MPGRTNLKTLVFILISSVVSFLIMCAIFPDLLVFHKRAFMYQHDTGIPFHNTFALTSFFYNGGIQLWDRYDQIGFTYLHLTHGLYTLVNIISATIYVLLNPFMKYPGEAFVSLYAILHYGLMTLIRSIGGYLLLKRFTNNPIGIFLGIVYLNTLLSVVVYHGISTDNLYSYLPLLMYFILRFFEKFQLTDFLGAVLVMTICVANSALIALGYFYLAVHFFLISCILYLIIFRRKKNPANLIRAMKTGWTRKNRIKIVIGIVLCLLIILPNITMFQSLKEDFYVPNSGLGGTQGRLNKVFKFSAYFDWRGQSLASPKEFFTNAINYGQIKAMDSWPYLGASTLLFSILGLIFSKQTKKHIIFWAIALIILSNYPLKKFAITSIAHYINILNPFQFLIRSFHMSGLLMPFLFPPLVALGLESCWELSKNNSKLVYYQRIPLGLGFLFTFMIILAFHTPEQVRLYAAGTALVAFIYFYILWEMNFLKGSIIKKHWGSIRRTFLIGAFILLFGLDIRGLASYLNNAPYTKHDIIPRNYSGLETKGPIIVHYQNPKIFTFPERYRIYGDDIKPTIFEGQAYDGQYYHYTRLDHLFRSANIYNPRPIGYKIQQLTKELVVYIAKDNRLIYDVGYAINHVYTNLAQLVENNLDRDVVMIDANDTNLPNLIQKLPGPEGIKENPYKNLYRTMSFSLPFAKAYVRTQGPFKEFSFDLPDNVPRYLATEVFSKDYHSWNMVIGEKRLLPVQGKLTEPFTFDLQNMKEEKLTILLPKDFNVANKAFVLKKAMSYQITDVWRNEHDHMGFNYVAANDGWLVLNFPYDKKWRMTIDEKQVALYRANRHFMTTPITKGEHKVLLQYWPETTLRGQILLSIILIVIVFAGVTAVGIKRERLF